MRARSRPRLGTAKPRLKNNPTIPHIKALREANASN
jgi:hypothetical protein